MFRLLARAMGVAVSGAAATMARAGMIRIEVDTVATADMVGALAAVDRKVGRMAVILGMAGVAALAGHQTVNTAIAQRVGAGRVEERMACHYSQGELGPAQGSRTLLQVWW